MQLQCGLSACRSGRGAAAKTRPTAPTSPKKTITMPDLRHKNIILPKWEREPLSDDVEAAAAEVRVCC